MFGVTNSETVELLVHSIKRAGDFTAQIFLIDVGSAIYTADSGEIPAFDPGTTTPIDITTLPPDPPTIDDTASGTDVSNTSGGGSVSTLIVYLSPPANDVRIRGYRVRYRVAGSSQWTYGSEMENLTITISPVIEGVAYDIQAQSISVFGVQGEWSAAGPGTAFLPEVIPLPATGISAELVVSGLAYDYCAIHVTFTPPADAVYSYSEIYASKDNITYYYVGRDSTGSFVFWGLGSIYELGDTCYIKVRSVSTWNVHEAMPGDYNTSVVINGTIRLAGFYAGLDFFGDAETPADAKILLDKTNTLMRLGDTATPYLVMDGDRSGEPAVCSSNYVSGAMGAGFLLKSNLLEVGNAAIRGLLRTSVLEYDSISVHSGSDITVKGGDVLTVDMSADDNTTF